MSKFSFYLQKTKNWLIGHKWISLSILAGLVVGTALAIALPLSIGRKAPISNQQSQLREQLTEEQKTIEQNKEENGTLFSPFASMTMWTDTSSEYSQNGAINLQKVSDDTGIKVFHLGFINPDQNQYLNADGSIRWCWGGYYSIRPNGSDDFQYRGIMASIDNLRANGGEIVISFGGQAGISPWTCTQNETALKNMYKEVIEAYGVSRIDLDIETSNQDATHAAANARAVKALQDETGVQVSLTIPIMPYGWETKQLNIIEAYLDAGVNLVCINSMTMCYGGGLLPGEDYAWASVRAIKNAKDQLAVMLRERGINKTESELYGMLGATVAIGSEGSAYPIFTESQMQTFAEFAKSVNLGLLSFWSINRDAMLYDNSGINQMYGFASVCNEVLSR